DLARGPAGGDEGAGRVPLRVAYPGHVDTLAAGAGDRPGHAVALPGAQVVEGVGDVEGRVGGEAQDHGVAFSAETARARRAVPSSPASSNSAAGTNWGSRWKLNSCSTPRRSGVKRASPARERPPPMATTSGPRKAVSCTIVTARASMASAHTS